LRSLVEKRDPQIENHRHRRKIIRQCAATAAILALAPCLLGGTDAPFRKDTAGQESQFLPSIELALVQENTDSSSTSAPSETAPPSLQDLGFTADQARGSAEAQARLDKRSRMLKIHQRLGLITLVPMLATVITAGNASGQHGSRSGRNVHGALGLLTAGLYVTTASYALRAPTQAGVETRGPIRLHKALAWIHGVGMILTPILGAMARSQLDRGEKVHGIASAHSAVAGVTIAAYAAAIGTVAVKF
jgi:hypothetical protein